MSAAPGSSRDICPKCSSPDVAQLDPTRAEDPQADRLTADAPAQPAADPPNMRCAACGHRWWRAPRAAPMSEGEEGVRP
jgi:hypothetical protein